MLTAVALGTGLATIAVAGSPPVRFYHTRPQILRGLPPHDYQPPQPPPVVPPAYVVSDVAFTIAPLPLPLPAGVPTAAAPARSGVDMMSAQTAPWLAADRLRIRVYQFPAMGLGIDHCGISRMALTTREDGFWRLSLRADQNPRPEPTSMKTAPDVQAQVRGLPDVILKQTGHLKRNLFVVRLRGLGSFTEALPVNSALPVVGKPVLAEFPDQYFWVQSGVPRPYLSQGVDPDIAASFDRIDRVELEFSYR
jgi:hypothetical protein